MLRLATAAASVAFGAVLVSCGGGGAGTPTAPTLDGTSWRMTEVAGAAAQPGGMLGFSAGRLTGATGCNSFHGTYQESGGALTIKLGPTTLIGCLPPLEAQERAVLAALPRTASFMQDDDTLTLLDGAGTALLAYAHLGPSALVGPNWEVTGLNNGKEAVVSPIAGTSLTARFGDDGHVSGSAGCNTYNAGYALDNDKLHVDAAITTRMHCETPKGVTEQELAFLRALEGETTVEPAANAITLRDASGAIQVILAEPGR